MRALGIAASWPVRRAVVGVAVRSAEGAGRRDPAGPSATVLPDVRTDTAAFPEESRQGRFPWASLTKLVTAYAVLVAFEEGALDLADPAGPPGSTIEHLLAHASGLGPTGRVLMAPGRRRIYSGAGYELLGIVLAARTGIPFATYAREAVLEPLGMDGTRFGASESPSHSLRGTVSDLLALGRELLVPTLVDGATLARATAVAFPGLDGVLPGFGRQAPNDWGLGFELRDTKRPHWTGASNAPATFGHFGQAGGFLWVDPVAGVACGALTDEGFGPWALAAWPPFSDAVLAEVNAEPTG
jgi:CubicO group peptidase (beta-lactamase class C family)